MNIWIPVNNGDKKRQKRQRMSPERINYDRGAMLTSVSCLSQSSVSKQWAFLGCIAQWYQISIWMNAWIHESEEDYLAVKSPGKLCLNHHDNNAKHPADQGVVTQLFALPKESSSLPQAVANVLSPLLWCAAFVIGQVFTVGLTGVVPDDSGEGVLQDATVKKLKRLLAWVKICKTGS